MIKIDHAYAAGGKAHEVRFCSRCGEPAERPPRAQLPLASGRVCPLCGMGVLLSCVSEALPGAHAAFLIVTSNLAVSAVSDGGEVVFGAEQELVGRPLTGLLSANPGHDLQRTVIRAALRSREPALLPVRGVEPRARSQGEMVARVSTCGPPRAALVTVEPALLDVR